jgi:hypothetical protein
MRTQYIYGAMLIALGVLLSFATFAHAQSFYTVGTGTCGYLGTQTLGVGRIAMGAGVMSLQSSLQSLGYFNGPITGFYNADTRLAVQSFQSTYGLVPDGVVGPITRSYISSLCQVSSPSFAPYVPVVGQQAYTPSTASVYDAFSGFSGFSGFGGGLYGNGASGVTASDVYVNNSNGGSYRGGFFGGNSQGSGGVDIRLDRIRSITDDSATIEGEIHDEGRGEVRVWIEYDRNRNDVLSGNGERETLSGRYDEGDEFDEKITNLNDDTRYYVRVCGQDEDGYIDCSSTEDFRTDDNGGSGSGDLEISVESADNITDDSAKIRGEVEDEGSGSVEIWIEIDKDESDLEDGDGQSFSLGNNFDENDSFSITINGLDDDTRYYYRACGEDDDGDEDCSQTRDFETDN